MTGESFNKNQSKESKAAVAKGVLKRLVKEIMLEGTESGNVINEFDSTNPHLLTRTEIYLYYVSHDLDNQPREPLLRLGTIAEKVIPTIHGINETIAKEVVSIVGRRMLRKQLTLELIQQNEGQPLNDLQLADIEDKVDTFNANRRQLANQKGIMDINESDPEYFIRHTENARKGRQHEWTPEQNARLEQLRRSTLWPEGSVPAGKTNWGEVARILSEEFKVEFTTHQVISVYDKRKRTARKRGQQ